MTISNNEIAIKYQTRMDYCRCCDRDYDNSELSDVREFEVRLKDIFEWADWAGVIKYEDSLVKVVGECLFDILSFYFSSDRTAFIYKGEADRVSSIIKNEYKEEI